MSDAAAIISVVTTGAVALGVAGLNGFLELRRARWKGKRERLDELREVLDASGAAVSEAVVAAEGRVVAGAADERARTGADFNDKFASVQLFENRIAIRLDASEPAWPSYHNVVEELRGLRKDLYRARGELNQKQKDAATATISRVEAAHRTFLDNARRLVESRE